MLIRTATLDDAEALREYAVALFAENLSGIYARNAPTLDEERAYVSTHLDPPNSTMLVAEVDGEIAGMIGFEGRKLAEEAHVGEFGLSVARDHRGHGIGTALIVALLEWAPVYGITRIEVSSWSNNPRASELYRRCGFQDEGVRRGAILRDGETVDVITMARLLDR